MSVMHEHIVPRSLQHEAQALVSERAGRMTIDMVLASLVVFLLPIQTLHVFSRSFDVGVMLAAVLAPLFVPALLWSRPAARLVSLLLGSVCFGALLTEFSSGGDRSINRTYELGIIGLLIAGALAVTAFTWARGLLSIRAIAALFAAGALADGLINSDLWQSNAWKYAFGWPIAVLVLAATSRRSRVIQLLALTGLALVGATYDDRSFLGFCLVAATFVVFGFGRTERRGSWSPLRVAKGIAGLALVSVAVYQVGTYLALAGVLGSKTRRRTQVSVASGESPIAAGRPEWAAALALAQERAIGYGPGVAPSGSELSAAKEALAKRGVDPQSSYVEEYMFGGHIELHSILGDLWVGFGLAGLCTAVYMIWRIVRGVSLQFFAPSALLVFMAIATLWDIAFSPLPSTFLKATLTFCLLLTVSPSTGDAAPARTSSAGSRGSWQ